MSRWFAEEVARLGRSNRPAVLEYDTRDGRAVVRKPGRLGDPALWCAAAEAEVLGREPIVRWQLADGRPRWARPWLEGEASAWDFLLVCANADRHPRARSLAEATLQRLLEEHGLLPPDE